MHREMQQRMKATSLRVVLICAVTCGMVMLLWASGHTGFEVSQMNMSDALHTEDSVPVLQHAPTGVRAPKNETTNSQHSHSVCRAGDAPPIIESRLAEMEQCQALGPVFVKQLAAYIYRHGDCRRRSNSMERVLMYSCESDKAGHFCGGMGDRFRGMISVFLLALLSDRRFELFHPTPVPIEEYLEPNLYHYVPDASLRGSRADISRVPVDQSLMRLQRHKKFLRTLDNADSTGVSVLRVQSNSAGVDPFVHRYPRWAARKDALGLPPSCNISCYFGCLHRVLFKASAELLTKITPSMPSGKFIAVQVRMGGSWAPGMRIAEPFRTPPAAVPHFISMLRELQALGDPQHGATARTDLFPPAGDVLWMRHAPLFVSSDAPRLIAEVAKSLNRTTVRWIDGGFGHTDTLNLGDVKPAKYTKLSAEEIRENYALTMANHYILSQGSHMVMAQSGFGDTAFWRSRQAASCVFVDMSNLNLGWQHHLAYGGPASSASAVRSRYVDLSKRPEPFYEM
jgi:hypothetical protein